MLDDDTLGVLTLVARGKIRPVWDRTVYRYVPIPTPPGATFTDACHGIIEAMIEEGVVEPIGDDAGLTLSETGWRLLAEFRPTVVSDIRAGRVPEEYRPDGYYAKFDDRYM